MCARVCARAPRSRSVSPFNVTDTFPRSLRPPHGTATGSTQSRPRPAPARAPLIEPDAHQSASPLPVLGRLPAPAGRGRCHCRCSSGPGVAGAGLAARWLSPSEVNKVQYPSAARGWGGSAPTAGSEGWGAAAGMGLRAALQAVGAGVAGPQLPTRLPEAASAVPSVLRS